MSRETVPAVLFPQPPCIRFVPEQRICKCGNLLYVQKTRQKIVFTLSGPFVAHETIRECAKCSCVYSSQALLRKVPRHCNVAFDVLVFVGQALFRFHRNIKEVQTELRIRNVHLCPSEINYLGRKFITYLAVAHRQATPRIRQKMEMAGGYILHLDATHEADAPALMSGIDSLSRFVLANVKIPSEKADYIIPFLQQVQSSYGKPIACVHDMGTGLCKAVETVFPGIKDFVCHFHFLRDIGKDFLDPAYSQLRKCLRKHAISTKLHALVRQLRQNIEEQGCESQFLTEFFKTGQLPEDCSLMPLISAYSLALWVLHGKRSGNGYGFPFDRPLLHFAERVLELNHCLPEFLNLLPDDNTKRPLRRLAKQISASGHDKKFLIAIKELRWRIKVFDDLRNAMRIAPENKNNGLNDDGGQESMDTIRKEVKKFRNKLKNKSNLASDTLCQKIGKQIDKYSEKLFADPIEVSTPAGLILIYPQRTNNILEQFFRSFRRTQRRKTGNNSLNQMLNTMLAQTPLIKNLDNPEYMDVLLNGEKSMEDLFAEIDKKIRFEDYNSEKNNDRILPGFRSVMKLKNLPELIGQLFAKR